MQVLPTHSKTCVHMLHTSHSHVNSRTLEAQRRWQAQRRWHGACTSMCPDLVATWHEASRDPASTPLVPHPTFIASHQTPVPPAEDCCPCSHLNMCTPCCESTTSRQILRTECSDASKCVLPVEGRGVCVPDCEFVSWKVQPSRLAASACGFPAVEHCWRCCSCNYTHVSCRFGDDYAAIGWGTCLVVGSWMA